MKWIDSHNHLQKCDLRDFPGRMRAVGVVRCVANGTHEGDWQVVAGLAARWPDLVVPAFGVHPWQAGEAMAGWLDRLREMLDRVPQAGVGECGLDGTRRGADPERQRAVLRAQLRLARDMERSVTVHCVRAWGGLLDVLAEEPPPERFLMHGFGGSWEVARRLAGMGAYFSGSWRLLELGNVGMLDVFRRLPRERILLETDGGRPEEVAETGRRLAVALGMVPEELAALTTHNAAACFGWDRV